MKYSLYKLDSGLRILTIPMPSLESATVTVWVGTGSRYEDPKANGISHFLEHMVFKGSKKRPTARAIAEAVDSFGGEFNAGTSKEWTNFYIKARKENLDTAFDVLSDMVLNPIIDGKEVAREKGVICEEIAMYEDTPMFRIGDIFEQLIFKGGELAMDVAGTSETVKGIQRNDFLRYRKSHYYPDNIILTIAGGIDEKNVIELAKKYFLQLKAQGLQLKAKTYNFQSSQKKPQIQLHSKKKEQAHLILGFLGNKRGHEDRFKEAILSAILGGGMSSRLFTEVRERRGLAYAVKAAGEHYKETGYLATYAGVDVKRIDEAIKVIIDEHYKIVDGRAKISRKELIKAKEYLKGQLALSLEDTKNVSGFFGEQELLLNRIETPQEVFEAINKVTADEVIEVAKKLFVPEKLNLAIIGPYGNSEKFKNLLRI